MAVGAEDKHNADRVQNLVKQAPYTEFNVRTSGEGRKSVNGEHIKRKIAWFLAIAPGKDMSCSVMLS